MLRLIYSLFISFPLFFTPSALAHDGHVRLSYAKLYSQLKYNLKPEYQDIQVTLFFVNSETGVTCKINKAWMEKERKFELFSIPDDNHLPLPLDSNLRSANPLVYVDLLDSSHCDYQFILTSKEQLRGNVEYAQLNNIVTQMQPMFDDLGGMLARWFAPKVIGVTLKFAPNVEGVISTSKDQSFTIKQGIAQIDLSRLSPNEILYLPQQTTQVLPFIAK